MKSENTGIGKGEYETIFKNLPFIAFTLDRKGKILNGNKHTEKLIGMKAKDLLGKGFSEVDILSKKDMIKALIEFRKNLKGKVTEKTIYEIRNRKGEDILIEIIGIPIKEKGKVNRVLIVGENITERKKISEKIRENEEKLRSLIELAPYGIIFTDLKGTVKSCNTAFVKLTGYSKDRIIGKNFTNLPTLRKRDIPRYLKLFTEIIRGKIPKPFGFEWKRKDGSIWKGEMRIGLAKTGGKLKGFHAFVSDITDKKEAEDVLRESEKKYRILTETTPDGIFTTSKLGFLTYVNPALSKMFGIPPEKSLGKHFSKYVTKKSALRAVKMFMKMKKGGRIDVKNIEFEAIGKNKKRFPIEVSASPFIRGGKFEGIECVVRNVAKQKKSEAEIRKERDKAQMYLEIAGVIFLATDKKGNVTLINKKGCKILGYEQDEIMGKNWIENFLPEKIRDEFREYAKGIVSGKRDVYEYHENPVLTKSGEEKLVAWHNKLIMDSKGKIIGHFSSGEDITEKRKKEDALKKRTEESEKFTKLSVGRELRMVELKRRVKELEDMLRKHGIEPGRADNKEERKNNKIGHDLNE